MEVNELIKKIRQGDSHLKEELVKQQIGLIKHFMLKFHVNNYYDDIYQDLIIVLLDNFDKWEEDRGRFSTFISWYYTKYLIGKRNQYNYMAYIPDHVIDKTNKCFRVAYELNTYLGKLTNNDLENNDIPINNYILVNKADNLKWQKRWIGDIVDINFKKSYNTMGQPKEVENTEGYKLLSTALTKCTERSRNIVLKRAEGFTLEQVGKMYGLTRERIRQIESKTHKMLKTLMLESGYTN